MQFLSIEQCLGYVACVLGIIAFLQKDDVRLKKFLVAECAFYSVHFWLLNNAAAALSALVSGCRSGVAIKTRSWSVAALFVGINVVLGLTCAHHWLAFLPITAGVLGTIAVFGLKGAAMRLVLLIGTLCWLVNNIASGSIGGMILETFIALANGYMLARLYLNTRRAQARVSSIESSYPGFDQLPVGLQQLLVASERGIK